MYDLKQTIERVGADRIVNKDIKVELGVVYVEADGTQFKYEQDNWHQFCEICWVNLKGGKPSYETDACLDDILFEKKGE